ncbi:unnamed protein product, partial [Mesorhabditis spiculigera]
MWRCPPPVPFNMPVGAGPVILRPARPFVHRRSARTGAHRLPVAVKDRLNGSLNPYAHLRQPDITFESVQASQMLWDPIRYDETCLSSDGACALVIGNEEAAAQVEAEGRSGRVDPRNRHAHRADLLCRTRSGQSAGRPDAAAALWKSAESPIRSTKSTAPKSMSCFVVRADVVRQPRFRGGRPRLKLTEAGETAIGGKPWSMPGGVLFQPDRRPGMIRFAEFGDAGHAPRRRSTGGRRA